MSKKPSTKGGEDTNTVGPENTRPEIHAKGTLDGALKASKAAYQKDPAAKYLPHDGE